MNAESLREVERRANSINKYLADTTKENVDKENRLVTEFYEFLAYNEMGGFEDLSPSSANIINTVVTQWLVLHSVPFKYYMSIIRTVNETVDPTCYGIVEEVLEGALKVESVEVKDGDTPIVEQEVIRSDDKA